MSECHCPEWIIAATAALGREVTMRRHARYSWRRLRHLFIVSILAGLLFVVNLVVGCETDEEPAVYYGPPPADDAIGGDTDPGLPDIPTYYGPVPVDVHQDAAKDADVPQGPDFSVEYGPPPIDIVDAPDPIEDTWDASAADVDVATSTDVPTAPDSLVVFYGPSPVDVKPASDCQPGTFYGPMPCDTDEQCETEYGAGWYCDETNTVDDGCGNPINWPICREP